jgi:hypothetical protein
MAVVAVVVCACQPELLPVAPGAWFVWLEEMEWVVVTLQYLVVTVDHATVVMCHS